MRANKRFMRKVERSGGKHCPCCGQFAKIYKRGLGATQAFGLISLFNLSFDRHFNEVNSLQFFHTSEIMANYGCRTQGGDFVKAAYWGLIEEMFNNDERKKNSGMWRLTNRGVAFVKGVIELPAFAFVYDGKVQGFTTETVNIRKALHKRFDYAELMNIEKGAES